MSVGASIDKRDTHPQAETELAVSRR